MTDQQRKLSETVQNMRARIGRYQDRSLGEQNTKASLIEPILEALGWDVRDPDEVYREFKANSRDNPVDYALTLLRKPRLFVEAKGLGEDMADRKWISQVLAYAVVAGVEWCVLTDGNEYRFYNATVAVDAEEKLFCRIKLSDSHEVEAAKTLSLISRANMEENLLEVLWNAHYVDRRVKQALHQMCTAPEKGIVRLIRRRVSKLTPREIVQSLRRLDFRIEIPSPLPEAGVVKVKPKDSEKTGEKTGEKTEKKERKKARAGRTEYGVTLQSIIDAGYLKPPLRLFRKYKGQVVEAQLLANGTVEFGKRVFPSCSTAGEEARAAVTGRRMNTNGWSFWRFTDGDGKKCSLDSARQKYLAAKGG